jgi:hypothetical protein
MWFFGVEESELRRAIALLGDSYRSAAPRWAFTAITQYLVRLKQIDPAFTVPDELMARLAAERVLL